MPFPAKGFLACSAIRGGSLGAASPDPLCFLAGSARQVAYTTPGAVLSAGDVKQMQILPSFGTSQTPKVWQPSRN